MEKDVKKMQNCQNKESERKCDCVTLPPAGKETATLGNLGGLCHNTHTQNVACQTSGAFQIHMHIHSFPKIKLP